MDFKKFNEKLSESIQQSQKYKFQDERYFNQQIDKIVSDIWWKVDKFFDYNDMMENGISDDMGSELVDNFLEHYYSDYNDEDEDDSEGNDESEFIRANYKIIADKLQQKFEETYDNGEDK